LAESCERCTYVEVVVAACLSDTHVAAVMRELNTRPRKGLGYDTPQGRFLAEMRSPQPSIPATGDPPGDLNKLAEPCAQRAGGEDRPP
jgi:hypothetical protein